MDSPWLEQTPRILPPMLVFHAWTSTGKITAVWQSNAAVPIPAPVVRVHDAASGVLEQTIHLPRTEHEGHELWARMQGDFCLEHWALSSTHKVLAMALEDLQGERTSAWLVHMESGSVNYQEVSDSSWFFIHGSIRKLTSSFDGQILAVFVISSLKDAAERFAGLWLLCASPGQSILSTYETGRHGFTATHDNAFILPGYRTVFQESCNPDNGGGYILHHVPAIRRDGRYRQQHPFTHIDENDMEEAPVDYQNCSLWNSLTLDDGSLSPDGNLFVTLSSAGNALHHVLLEHWQMDHKRRTCQPQVVHSLDLGFSSYGLSCGSICRDDDDDDDDMDTLHVAWHPLCGDRLLYAMAVVEWTGMVHIIDGRNHVTLKAIDISAHGAAGAVCQLQWSFDGMRLGVCTSELIHVVALG